MFGPRHSLVRPPRARSAEFLSCAGEARRFPWRGFRTCSETWTARASFRVPTRWRFARSSRRFTAGSGWRILRGSSGLEAGRSQVHRRRLGQDAAAILTESDGAPDGELAGKGTWMSRGGARRLCRRRTIARGRAKRAGWCRAGRGRGFGNPPRVPMSGHRAERAARARHHRGQPVRSGVRAVLIAVTGTNGKTTTTYLVEAMLARAGRKPGVIGTVTYRFGGRQKDAAAHHARRARAARHPRRDARGGHHRRRDGSDVHALEQGRLAGCRFRVAALTNLTQDHLDYHGTMERTSTPRRSCSSALMAPGARRCLSPTTSRAAMRAALVRGARARPAGPRRRRRGRWSASSAPTGRARTFGTPPARWRSPRRWSGEYNLANLSLAVGMAIARGISAGAIAAARPELRGVPGRLERVANDARRALRGRLRAHARRARARAACAAAADRGRLIVRLRLRRRSRSRQAPAHGRGRGARRRPRDRHLRQPAHRGARAIIDMIVDGVRRAGEPERRRPRSRERRRGYHVEVDRRAAIRARSPRPRAGRRRADRRQGARGLPDRRHRRSPTSTIARRPPRRSPRGAARDEASACAQDRLAGWACAPWAARMLASRRARRQRSPAPPPTAARSSPGSSSSRLPGERVDGFDFAAQAAAAGAAAVVVARGRGVPAGCAGVAVIAVDDPRRALGDLARAVRARFGAASSASPARTARPRPRSWSPRRCGRSAHGAAHARQLQHRRRAAADDPLGDRGRGGLGARDGDARAAARSPTWPTSRGRTSASSPTSRRAHLETLGSIDEVARAKGELFARPRPEAASRCFPPTIRCIAAQAAPVARERAAHASAPARSRRRAGPRLSSRRAHAGSRRALRRARRRRSWCGCRSAARTTRATPPRRWPRRSAAGVPLRRRGPRPRDGRPAAAPLGALVAGRRAHHPRRLLQRQPGLDARGARARCGGRRRARRATPSRSWATCSSSARGAEARTASSAARPRELGFAGLVAVGALAPHSSSTGRAAGGLAPRIASVVAASPRSGGRASLAAWTAAGRLDPGQGLARHAARARRRGAADALGPRPKVGS